MLVGVSMHGDLKQLLSQGLTPHLDLWALQSLKQTNKAWCLLVEALNPATWELVFRFTPRPSHTSVLAHNAYSLLI